MGGSPKGFVEMISGAEQALLSLLRANARASTAELARQLGVSRTTVQSRIERLEQRHVDRPRRCGACHLCPRRGLPAHGECELMMRRPPYCTLCLARRAKDHKAASSIRMMRLKQYKS